MTIIFIVLYVFFCIITFHMIILSGMTYPDNPSLILISLIPPLNIVMFIYCFATYFDRLLTQYIKWLKENK